MTLGKALIDGDGNGHEMVNLLPLITSFERRRLNLGYRRANLCESLPFGEAGTVLTAHEFHYSTMVSQRGSKALFSAQDARGDHIGACGMVEANVAGSYLHLIDRQ